MWSTALIVFRETLEAALFVGIVAASTRGLVGRARWLSAGVAAGVLGALMLAAGAERISAWAEGVGQDLVNVGILSVALGMLAWHCIWVSNHGREAAQDAKRLGLSVRDGSSRPWALMVAVALAVLREGAETVLFVSGLATGAQAGLQTVMLGTATGLAGGAVVGWAMYQGLARVSAHRLFAVTNAMILILAAAIASQLARALAQAGLINLWSGPVWDSSAWLTTNSAVGALLHALVGYDAQPSGLQVVFYLGALALIVWGSRQVRRAQARPSAASPAIRAA